MGHVNDPVPQLAGNQSFATEANIVLARALAKDPADRHHDAATLRHDLERLAADAPEVAAAAATIPRPTSVRSSPGGVRAQETAPPARSRRTLWAIAAVVSICLVVPGAIWAALSGEDEPPGAEVAEPGISGDLDGDGHCDLQVQQTREGTFTTVGLWEVGSTGHAFSSPQRGGVEEGRPRTADVDGDGTTDQLWIDKVSLEDQIAISVAPGDGDSWSARVDLDPALFGVFTDVAVGDVTDDGLDDLILQGRPSDGPAGIHIAASTGDGFEKPTQWLSFDSREDTDFILAADVDGDGDSDVLNLRNVDGDDAAQVLTSTDGTLEADDAQPIGRGEVSYHLAAWMIGDVDGDSANELVIPTATCRAVNVYDLDGASLRPTPWFKRNLDERQARACFQRSSSGDWILSDVDGDGDDDLVELQRIKDDQPDLRVYAAEGDGFADPVRWGHLACDEECGDKFGLIPP